jgi:putative endonuclease
MASEETAALFLERQGYRILRRRFKTSVGEVDIIARDGESLVFVEVKFRQEMDAALETLSEKQRNRLFAAAEVFLSLEEDPSLARLPMRFDVIAMTPTAIQHLKNAFWKEE